MNDAVIWRDPDTFILSRLELFNWGGFSGLHQAVIDAAGTAIIGPTGSGKTTLVDALMTLLCASPRYNLASTGGHESDRDLVSYVRGVSGPGDGGGGQSHIARPGKTVTAIAATLEREGKQVRLGALLWFEDTSSTATDMKKLWLFSDAPEHTMEHWLNQHYEGGMRALRQMEKDGTGIWTYPGKKNYLARLRGYFEVGENAFTLLNRAAGLKQLNSIDDIFRELVLDDHSVFERAAEVATSFDDLTGIHQELEIARRQQQSLQPIAEGWERYQVQNTHLQEKKTLAEILPVWFAEQAHRLWRMEVTRLQAELAEVEADMSSHNAQLNMQKGRVEDLRHRYLQVGGASIDDLAERIKDWEKNCAQRQSQSRQYQQLVKNLDLPDILSEQSLLSNQREAQGWLSALDAKINTAKEHAFSLGVTEREMVGKFEQLQKEKLDAERRPGSNVPSQFQTFRSDLAIELGLDENVLPFVAELIQVKPKDLTWRGAIERAIGSHRLRIIVPSGDALRSALRWVNERHNRLHVRLLEFSTPVSQPRFFSDGFTQKLSYKKHPYIDAVKALLADNDRHCVDDSDQLRETPHAMTAQGLMSGKARFFDKQDQKRLDDDWVTGFDNRDRLALLAQQILEAGEQAKVAIRELRIALDAAGRLQDQAGALRQLLTLEFETIDLPGAQEQLAQLQKRLEILTCADSDAATAKTAWEAAAELYRVLESDNRFLLEHEAKVKADLKVAEPQAQKSYQRSEAGMAGEQRILGAKHFPEITAAQLNDIADLERDCAATLRKEVESLEGKLKTLMLELARRMSDAKKEDTGALSEVGRDLEDIPLYLERLKVLTEEALPEKLKRFLDYLNRSSDEGVTQLLSTIDHEVSMIVERLGDLNDTMRRVDFQPGRYLRLVATKVSHESVQTLLRAQRQLTSSRFVDDDGESQYKALQVLIALLKDACERNRTQGARTLLDPRFRLEFAVSVIERDTGIVIETRTGSQGGSGGEKEIIASYVLTASLSYALCPDGSSRPLFGTIILDEAFSRSSHAVASRIIAALREFGLHAVFITPNKELRLLRHHTRSAIVVHRRGSVANLTSLSWEVLDAHHQQHVKAPHEVSH
jgi:uncharacterized protein YPO0396